VVLPLGLGHHLHLHAASRKIHATHGIEEKERKTPQRDELETALRLDIVTGSMAFTTGAIGFAARARPDLDFKDATHSSDIPTSGFIDKTRMRLNRIQDRPEQHSRPTLSAYG
jgi:hypothetical protein